MYNGFDTWCHITICPYGLPIVDRFMLAGNWTTYDAEDHLDLLHYWFRLSVESFAEVRSLRVTDVEVKFEGATD